MWKNYVARGRALLGWRRMACALADKVAGSRAHGLQRLRKRTDGPDARAQTRSILRRGEEGLTDFFRVFFEFFSATVTTVTRPLLDRYPAVRASWPRFCDYVFM